MTTAHYPQETVLDSSGQQEVSVRDLIILLKPRVMSLVVFTGLVGMLMAPGYLHPVLFVVAILCIAVGAGAAGAINMWYDRDIDAVMKRTKNRPIPSGRVTPGVALGFGVSLAVASVSVMALAGNEVAAALLAFTIFFYVVVYTIGLKRRTPQNIVIGGAAGAFPPMIGWAAVGGEVTYLSAIMFAIIFLWTPPHFWALALYKRGDYEKAGVPMLPVVAGRKVTSWQIFGYTLVLLPVTLLPSLIGYSGIIYGVGALMVGSLFLLCSISVITDKTLRSARRMFPFSIFHLFLIFALLLVDRYFLVSF